MTLDMNIKNDLRPCYVRVRDGVQKKAFFHCWDFKSTVIEPSLMIGGHPGGTVAFTRGIVEIEGGQITTVMPESIRFIDNKFDDYNWDDGV